MYYPEFSITTKILDSIGKIEASRSIINYLPKVPSWQKHLQRESEIKNIYHSNHFEGNPTAIDQVKALMDGKNIDQSKRSLKEIENYKKALNILYLFKVDDGSLKSLHKTLLKEIAPEQRTGIYRTTATQIQNTNIAAPAPDEILAQLRSFLYWFESIDAKELPSPIKTAILYYEILKIQPFETENKKIAGLVALLNLYLEGYNPDKFICFENYFDESPTAFYHILRSVQSNEGDLTKWVEYFLFALSTEFERLKDKVITLSKDNKIRKLAGMTPLNDRQERIIEYLHDYGSLQNKDFVRLFPELSEDTILRDLKDLMGKNLIVKVGSTKSARYTTKVQTE